MSNPNAKASKHVTFWEALDKFPPGFVRMLAKNGADALSDAEVAIGSGLTIDRVRQIKFLPTWQTVPLGEICAFFLACNFDPTNAEDRNRVYQYEYVCKKRKTIPFQYLRKHPKWESEFLPLVKEFQSRLRSLAA